MKRETVVNHLSEKFTCAARVKNRSYPASTPHIAAQVTINMKTPQYHIGDAVLINGEQGVILGFDPRHCFTPRFGEYQYLIQTLDGTTWAEESELELYELDGADNHV